MEAVTQEDKMGTKPQNLSGIHIEVDDSYDEESDYRSSQEDNVHELAQNNSVDKVDEEQVRKREQMLAHTKCSRSHS